MKLIVNKILIVAFFLFGAYASAQPCPPGNPDCPPGPPELPINSNLIVLLIAGICFGLYTIYKHKFKTKASV